MLAAAVDGRTGQLSRLAVAFLLPAAVIEGLDCQHPSVESAAGPEDAVGAISGLAQGPVMAAPRKIADKHLRSAARWTAAADHMQDLQSPLSLTAEQAEALEERFASSWSECVKLAVLGLSSPERLEVGLTLEQSKAAVPGRVLAAGNSVAEPKAPTALARIASVGLDRLSAQDLTDIAAVEQREVEILVGHMIAAAPYSHLQAELEAELKAAAVAVPVLGQSKLGFGRDRSALQQQVLRPSRLRGQALECPFDFHHYLVGPSSADTY